MINKKQVLASISNVLDPELNISLVDMGLIYDVKIDKSGNVKIIMTLTTIGCPLFDIMVDNIKTQVKKIKGIKKVDIELTFDPPWSIEKMTKNAKVMLGLI